jgi:hypothetical protein
MKLIHFIKLHPNANWNWYVVSKCKGISWEDIKENINLPWNSIGIAENPNITYEILKKNYDFYSNILSLTAFNIHKPMDFNDENIYDFIDSYPELSINPYLCFTFVDKNLDKDWDWKELSMNKNITANFVKNHLDKLYLRKLVKNPVMNLEILELILENKSYHSVYDFYKISQNPNFELSWLDVLKNANIDTVNMDLVVKHKNLSWSMIMESEKLKSISDIKYNPNVTFDIIQTNPQIKWDFLWLSGRSHITWENIKSTLDIYPWNIKQTTYNPNVTWESIKEFPTLNWDWAYISLKFKISEDDIGKYPIYFEYFSSNPYVTKEIVEAYQDKPWNYNELIKTIF